MIPAIVIAAIVLVLLLWGVTSYNKFVSQRNVLQESWRQVDVELTRRHDLIPNLVETVKGYAAHEKGTLDAVISARAAASKPGSTPAEQAQQEGVLQGALGRLLAIAEAYPNLKADGQFIALQNQLTETEDRIAAGRRFYNSNVRAFNTRLQAFPSSIIGNVGKFTAADYFETEDPAVRAAPAVSFQQP